MPDRFTRLHALFVFVCPIYTFNENKKTEALYKLEVQCDRILNWFYKVKHRSRTNFE